MLGSGSRLFFYNEPLRGSVYYWIPGQARIGLSPEDAEASIRFSLGFDTTDADIDDAVNLIDNALGRLSNTGLLSDKVYRVVG